MITRIILSMFFSLFSLWGFQIDTKNSVSYFQHPFIYILLMFCFYLIIAGIDRLIDRLNRTGNLEPNDRSLFLAGLCIILVWIIVWLALFPGLAIYDGPTQLFQFKQGTISTHHPYIHSAFLGFCEYISDLLHFEDYSFFNSLFQLIFQWLCYMRVLFTMKQLRCKRAFFIFTILFMALYPINAFMALTTTKDTIFTGFFILFMCEMARLFLLPSDDKNNSEQMPSQSTDKDREKTGDNSDNSIAAALVRTVVFGVMMSIFRNNGIYVFIAAFPFVLLIRSRIGLKKWTAVYLSVIAFALLYSWVVASVLHIERGDSREALSTVIQPLARIYQSVPGELSEEEKSRIRNIFGGNEDIPYISYISDEPKLLFDTKFFLSEFKDNIKLFSALFLRYPTGYLDAWLATNLGNFYPLESLPLPFKVYYEIPLQDQGHSLIPWLYDKIVSFARNSGYRFSKLLTIWLSSGIALWKLLYWMYYIIRHRDFSKLYICLFPLMLFFTMFLGPTVVIRYTQPITVSIPLILAVALYTDERVPVK
ncbi:MAG: DUF6020 family protein [Lachnospiraceae bacterium]|nr:DUF6020 family protein [Lachnospiraceae bacterium]